MIKTCVTICTDLLQLLFDGLMWLLFPRKRMPYNARLDSSRSVLSRSHTGYVVSGAEKAIALERAFEHMAVIGSSGSGKSSSVVINGILRAAEHGEASIAVHDPSGELWEHTAGALTIQGYACRRMVYNNAQESCGFNPLARIRSRTDAALVANLLVNSTLSSPVAGDPYWNEASEDLIALCINVLLLAPYQYRNLTNLRHLIDHLAGAGPKKVDRFVADHAPQPLFDAYKAAIGKPEKLMGNILSTAATSLKILNDAELSLMTSYDSIAFEELRTQPTAIFITTDVLKTDYYKGITSILITQLLETLMRRLPAPHERSVLLFLDEAAAFKVDLETILAQARKYRIGVQMSIQSEHQLTRTYTAPGAKTILQNTGTKLYFPGQDLATAQRLEAELGKHIVEDDKGVQRIVPLMTADQIMHLKRNQALLMCARKRPMLVRLRPYYRTRLQHLAALTPPRVVTSLPWTEVPLLPL